MAASESDVCTLERRKYLVTENLNLLSDLVDFVQKRRAWNSSIRCMFRFSNLCTCQTTTPFWAFDTFTNMSKKCHVFSSWNNHRKVKHNIAFLLDHFKKRSQWPLFLLKHSAWRERWHALPLGIDKEMVARRVCMNVDVKYVVHLDNHLCRSNKRNKWISKIMFFFPGSFAGSGSINEKVFPLTYSKHTKPLSTKYKAVSRCWVVHLT